MIKKIIKSKIFWSLAIIVVAGVSYAAFKPEPLPEYTTVAAEKQDLVQTVSVTGTVRGADEIDLNFQTTGVLNQLSVEVGDKVEAGDVLARLSGRQLENAVLEARAAWQSAQANLDKLITGASAEELKVASERVKSAEVSLEIKQKEYQDLQVKLAADEKATRDNISNTQRDLETARASLIRTMENELFDATTALNRVYDILNDTDAQDTLGALNSLTKITASISHTAGVDKVKSAQNLAATAKLDNLDYSVEAALLATYSALSQVSTALTDTYSMLVNTPSSFDYTQTEINTDKANISSDQTIISSSVSLVQTAETTWEGKQSALNSAENSLNTLLANKDSQINTSQGAVDNAQVALALAQAEYDLKSAPARIEDLNQQKAMVAKAYAALNRAQADLAEITLTAPLSGVITVVNYDIGEKTELSRPVMAILGESGLEIEVDIPESDIAKIQLNQKASITLDAFGEEIIFPGQVTFIDPAETIIQDVVYYKVKVMFVSHSEEVKPGMTANIDIVTAEKNDVLVVPARAVKQNSIKYVDLLVNNQEVEAEVVTGLRGDGGLVEIVSGLKEGDVVITFKK